MSSTGSEYKASQELAAATLPGSPCTVKQSLLGLHRDDNMDTFSVVGIHEASDERIIADLSQCFSVPFKNVQAIYREQLRRLAEGARIRTFLSVLAIRRTRRILRDDNFQRLLKTPG